MGALFTPVRGAQQIVQGAQRTQNPTEGETRGGIADMLHGFLNLLSPYLPGAVAAAPIPALAGAVGAPIGGAVGDAAAQALDAAPGTRQLSGEVGKLLGGATAAGAASVPAVAEATANAGRSLMPVARAAVEAIPRADKIRVAYQAAQQQRAMEAQATAGTPQRTVQGLAADRTLTHQPLPEMPGALPIEGPSMPSVPTAPENPRGVQLGDFARRLMNGQSLSGVPTPPLSNPGLPPLPAEFEAALRAKAADPAVRATPEQLTPVGPQAAPGPHPVYGQPLTKLDSDAVQSIAYHEPTQTARVQIKGRDYTLPMTPEMHNRLLEASADPQQSVGKLWNQEIRPTLETKSGVLGPKAATATPEASAPTMEQRLAASPDAVALRSEVMRRAASQRLSPADLESVVRKAAADINTGRAAGGNARGTIPDWVVADVLKGLR